MTSDCVFCKIVAGDVPASFVHHGENVVAFEDIAPVMPVHVLVIPKVCVPSVAELGRMSPETLAEMATVAQQVADERCDGAFRWVFNTGAAAGQSVFHVHGHVVGGKELPWPPA